jgi:SAM-dependent methyltransferase
LTDRVEILLGCGSRRDKLLTRPGCDKWSGLVTLDIADTHNPDIVHDISKLPLPFPDNHADEIHAYEVMEHVGQQGDFRFFFAQWEDIWRVLKPGGHFFGTSPHWSSPWLWGDPGHTRSMGPECMVYLDRTEYVRQVGKTPMTDYRFCYSADFEPVRLSIDPPTKTFIYILKAHKPVRA